jgi:hypothetical protein
LGVGLGLGFGVGVGWWFAQHLDHAVHEHESGGAQLRELPEAMERAEAQPERVGESLAQRSLRVELLGG